MLRASRRVLRTRGRLAFFVIHLRSGLSPESHAAAAAAAPGFVDSPQPYRDMLGEAGFRNVESVDVTSEYRHTSARWMKAAADLEEELRAALGTEVFEQKVTNRRQAAGAIEDGDVERTLFWASR